MIDKSKREDVVKEISMLWKERGFASGEQLALILSLGVKYSNNIVVLKEYIMEAVKSDDAKISQVDYQEPLFENIISAIEEYNTDQYCDIVGYLKNIDKAFPEKNIAQYFQMCIKKRIKDIEKGLKELEAQSDWTSSILAPQECWTDMDSKMEEAVDKIRRMSAEKYFAPIEEKAIIKKLEEKYAELSEKYVEAAVRDILNKAVIGEDKSIGKAIDEAESLRKKFSLESDRNNSNTYIPKVISAFFEDKITNAEEMAELCKIEGYIQESSKIIESVFGGTEKTLQEAQANLEQKKEAYLIILQIIKRVWPKGAIFQQRNRGGI